jgi:hypothetical protein
MLLHIVLIRPIPDLDTGAIDRLNRVLSGLQRRVPGIIGYNWGPNVSKERLARGFEYGYLLVFDSAAARDVYLSHPERIKLRPFEEAVIQESLVFDIEA